MHRFFLLLFMLACLLTGCSAPQDSDQFPDKSENLDAYFEDNPSDNEMGAAEFGLQDPMDTVYTYQGEPLEIPFSITGASSGITTGDRRPLVCGWSGPALLRSLRGWHGTGRKLYAGFQLRL